MKDFLISIVEGIIFGALFIAMFVIPIYLTYPPY